MASPFTIFRRYQKVLLAALTILAMFAFVFLDPRILGSLGLGGAVQDPVMIATSPYGSLKRSDLQNLVRQRFAVHNFLERLQTEALMPKLGGQIGPERLRMLIARQVEAEIGPTTEAAVGEGWLLARRAEELGLIVSDAAVNAYIRRTAGEEFAAEEIKKILSALRVSQRQIFQYLRHELLAKRLRDMFLPSLRGFTPAQRWDYYQKLNRRATVELVAMPVEKFTSQVANPGDAVLREFFEKHKERLPEPSSPEPGFREPHRVAIEYFKADYEKFVDPKSVSDEEISQYYEKNKETLFVETALPEEPKPEPKPDAKPEVKPAAKPEVKPEAKTAATPEVKPTAKPEVKPEAKPAVKPEVKPEAKPAAAPEAKPAAKPEVKPEAKPAAAPEAKPAAKPEVKPEAKPAAAPEAKPAAKPEVKPEAKPEAKPADAKAKTSSRSRSAVRLVSYQVEKADEKASAKTEAAKTEAAKTEPAKSELAKSEPAKAEPAKSDASAQPAPAGPALGAAPTDAKEAPAAEPKAPPKQYRPLEKVRDEIRTTLARQKARTAIDKAVNPIFEQMRKYGTAYVYYAAEVKTNPEAKAPAKPDIAAAAKQAGLVPSKTELVSARELQAVDIGRSTVLGASQPIGRFIFEAQGLYRQGVSEDLDGSKYLFWKVDESKEHVPKYDDPQVAERVLAAWKQMEARTLAEKEVQRLAARAAKQPQSPLKDSLKDEGQPILEPRPFSWVSHGAVGQSWSQAPPEITEVDGVAVAGDEFMKAVFALGEGQAGVAWNRPKTVAYVVRPTLFAPTTAVLWDLFLVDDFSKYASVAGEDQRAMLRAWMDEVKKLSGFEWKRPPDKHDDAPAPARQPAAPLTDPLIDF